jgi:hypothetical protein
MDANKREKQPQMDADKMESLGFRSWDHRRFLPDSEITIF